MIRAGLFIYCVLALVAVILAAWLTGCAPALRETPGTWPQVQEQCAAQPGLPWCPRAYTRAPNGLLCDEGTLLTSMPPQLRCEDPKTGKVWFCSTDHLRCHGG